MRKRKPVAAIAAVAVAAAVGAGGTLAYFTDSEAAVNTFTVGSVEIKLAETTGGEYEMVPGGVIAKDPTVTVLEGSEGCWLFAEVVESGNLDGYIDYEIADGWSALTGHDGVWYREVAAAEAGKGFSVLRDDQVVVRTSVTGQMLDAIDGLDANGNRDEGEDALRPTLAFRAYAVQAAGFDTAAQAWAEAAK